MEKNLNSFFYLDSLVATEQPDAKRTDRSPDDAAGGLVFWKLIEIVLIVFFVGGLIGSALFFVNQRVHFIPLTSTTPARRARPSFKVRFSRQVDDDEDRLI